MDIGIGIDVETSGCNLLENSIVAVGVAIMNMKTGELLEPLKRWTIDCKNIKWEQRCLTEFWDKFPDVKKSFVEATDVIGNMKDFGQIFYTWYNEKISKYGKFTFYSDFPLYDIMWINYALALSGKKPLYLLNNSWQSIDDTDAIEKGILMTGNYDIDMSDFTLQRHYPEIDAYYIVLRLYKLLNKIHWTNK